LQIGIPIRNGIVLHYIVNDNLSNTDTYDGRPLQCLTCVDVQHNANTCDYIQINNFFQIFTGVDVSVSVMSGVYLNPISPKQKRSWRWKVP